MSIKNVKGDLLTSSCVIRCHQVNCRGVMGSGIAKQIKEKYPEVFPPYQALCKQFGGKLLGEVQLIPCHDGTLIANLFGQDDWGTDKVQTDMPALEECFSKLYIFAAKTGASVGFPRLMGADRGGGDWNKIEALIKMYFESPSMDCLIVEWAPEAESNPPVLGLTDQTASVPEKSVITIHTDGSCLGNPGPGGWACILEDTKGHKKELSGGEAETTNNRMELTGVIEALKSLKRPCAITLYTDSAYITNSVNKGWLAGWKRSGWKKKDKKPVENIDLWKEIDALLEIHEVSFIWVKGHAANSLNNRCDELARERAKEFSAL